jgi:hypothetical protein
MLTPPIRAAIAADHIAHVTTAAIDGTPMLSVVQQLAVWDSRHLLIAIGAAPGVLAELGRNPAMTLTLADPHDGDGFRLRGYAVVLSAGELHARALARLGGDTRGAIALMQVDRARRLRSHPGDNCGGPTAQAA